MNYTDADFARAHRNELAREQREQQPPAIEFEKEEKLDNTLAPAEPEQGQEHDAEPTKNHGEIEQEKVEQVEQEKAPEQTQEQTQEQPQQEQAPEPEPEPQPEPPPPPMPIEQSQPTQEQEQERER